MEWLTDPQGWIALITLTALEIVLGIDNIIFITILVGKLPEVQRARARTLGLGLAMLSRIALLFSITLIMKLTAPLFSLFGEAFSGRDLILAVGGLFLIAKSTHEIHDKLEGEEGTIGPRRKVSFSNVLVQVMLLDVIFSLDSVITAVGMASHLSIMIAAVVIAVGFMMVYAGAVGDFVHRHPTIKMLALSFLLLIGVTLIADALHQHIPKGYIYFAMAFSVFTEMLNIRMRNKGAKPVRLHEQYPSEEKAAK